jgi:putative methionine-R-sulfoxide reductase with GAF domain
MHLQSKHFNVAIVGINRESAVVLAALIETHTVNVIRVVNDEIEDLHDLKNFPQLDIIINTTNSVETAQKLKRLNLEHVDILSGLSGRLLFSTDSHGIVGSNRAEDRNKLLNSLHEIREAIYLSKNKDELLKLVLSVAIRSVMADSGSIMLLDAKKRTLKIEIAEGLGRDIVASTIQKVGKGIAGTVAKTGKALLIKGTADKERYAGGFERTDLVSSICTPLVIGQETVGVLSVNSKSTERIFSDDDVRYIQNLADFSADIINTSKEYETIAGASFSLSVLGNIRDILELKYSFEERLNLILLKIENSFHAEICNYYDYFSEKKVFIAKASSSFNIKLIKGKKLKLNDFFSKEVIATGSAIVQNIPEKDGDKKKWYIAQPIKHGGEMTALLFLHLISSKEKIKGEIAVLEKIAEMVGNELGKSQEMESIRVQSIKFSAISEVSFDLATARNLNDLATIIISNVCVILEAESSILRLMNQHTGMLDIQDSFSLKSYSYLKKLEEVDTRISNDAVTKRDIMLIRELADSPYNVPDLESRSVMCMYLERNGRVLGTLSLYDKKSIDLYASRSFSHKDKELFLNFCLQASKALDRFLQNDMP